MSERILQSGDLGDLPFLDLVLAARNSAHPAILRVTRGDVTRAFYFRDGKLSAVVTDGRAESLTTMLVKRGKLPMEAARGLDDDAEAAGATPALLVLQRRLLPPPVLSQELTLWATLLLVQTFGWDSGSYRISLESVHDAPPETLLEISLPAALLKGVLKRLDIEPVRGMLESFRDARPRHAARPPFPAVAFDFDAHQLQFWDSLDGERTVGEILDFGGLSPDDAARMLYLLQRTGMIEMGAEREASVAAPAPARSAPPAAASGVDLSAIRFQRSSGQKDRDSGTFHAVASGIREEVGKAGRVGAASKVGVVTGSAQAAEEAAAGAASGAAQAAATTTASRIGALLDEVQGGGRESAAGAAAGARVAPPRGGRRDGWSAGRSPVGPGSGAGAAGGRGGTKGAARRPGSAGGPVAGAGADPGSSGSVRALSEGAESPDALPGGHGPDVDPEDWTRLTTKDKDRVRALRRQMSQMDSQNYFEWFSLSHEAPEASIKKAYFQLARLYHPDALVDEPKVYAAHAEALFARLSEAYDILDNEEERTKYIKKKILGEKDEQDLAREKVQKILAAENSFKAGQRFLNAGKLADALRHFRAAFEGYDQEAEYVAYYGFTLFRVKSASEPTAAQEGIELMKKATTMREMAPKPYHLLGKAYLQAGDWGEAKSWLRKSLKIQPDNPEALREYKRADDMQKGGATTLPSGKSGDEKGTGIAGLFGRFRKDKDAGKEKKAMTVEELLADGGEEEEE